MHYENAEFRIGKATYLSTDVGGVAEFYPSRRMVTRLDEGKRLLEKNAIAPSAARLCSVSISQVLIQLRRESPH
jgi:hypothetical protein